MSSLEFHGDRRRPVALVAHGAASTAAFVLGAFGEALYAAGWCLATWQRSPGASAADDFAAMASRCSPALVGGVSLGAHAAVTWTATTGFAGPVLLVLPAWTGPAGDLAAAGAVTAGEVDRAGIEGVLRHTANVAPAWVAAAVTEAWTALGAAAVAADLRAAAVSPGPTPKALASVAGPASVVTVADDPLHPRSTAEEWARLIPRATLTVASPRSARDLAVAGLAGFGDLGTAF